MKWHLKKDSRKIHRIGAILIALPFLIILVTGLLLQVKKDVSWVQPISQVGVSNIPVLTFDEILTISTSVPEAEITSWDDIDRLDVRPEKGMVKVRAINHWEIQIDTDTGDILQIEYRRSDIIEALHDGSWFSDATKYWVFLPTGIIVLILWISGVYLFFVPILNKRRNLKRISSIKEKSRRKNSL